LGDKNLQSIIQGLPRLIFHQTELLPSDRQLVPLGCQNSPLR